MKTDLNRITLQITPTRTFETKIGYVEPFHGIYSKKDNEFSPFLDEYITEKIPQRPIQIREKLISDKFKSNFNVTNLVGKRINVLWSNN